jgi:hypothetical protein
MIYIRRRYLVIGLAVLFLALAGGTTFAATHQLSGAAAVPVSHTPIVIDATPLGVGAAETTDEGLEVTLLQVVKNGPRWLFHIQLRNTVTTTLTIRGTSDIHQFVVAGGTGAAPPNNIGVARLGSPAASEIAANHPDLARTLRAGGTAQGWLAIDTTHLGFTPTQLLYRYRAVPTTACANPNDTSTCHPDTLYQALIWSNI